MNKSVPPHLLVERALALVPDHEDFLPLSDALIGASRVDADKLWHARGRTPRSASGWWIPAG